MDATARQEQLARADENCRYVRELLARKQPSFWALLATVVTTPDTPGTPESEVVP